MSELDLNSSITNRPLSNQEKKQMRKKHLFLLPLLAMFLLIIWVIDFLNTVPFPIQIVIYFIGCLAIGVYLTKSILLEKELSKGQVEVVRGVLVSKRKTGGSDGFGINDPRKMKPDNSFYFTVGEKEYMVTPKNYVQFVEYDEIEIVWFPRSKHLLSVSKLG